MYICIYYIHLTQTLMFLLSIVILLMSMATLSKIPCQPSPSAPGTVGSESKRVSTRV